MNNNNPFYIHRNPHSSRPTISKEEDLLKNALKKLEEINNVLYPFIIYIGNYPITQEFKDNDKLEFITHLPSFNSCKTEIEITNEYKQLYNYEKKNLATKAYKAYLFAKLTSINQYYNQRGYNINNINPLETKFISAYLTIALCGYSGCGKSTFINLSFGELVAKISKSCEDVKTKAAEYYLPIQDTDKKYLL